MTVDDAYKCVMDNLFVPEGERVEIQQAIGRTLGEPVKADRDFPPFNRVAMDGIAISLSEWETGRRTFKIEGLQAAGQPQGQLQETSHCIEVMTGAMLPIGVDAVIRYEDLLITDGEARVEISSIQPMQNVHQQGADGKRGDLLLEKGRKLSPAEIALLASVGMSDVTVLKFPRVAIVSTGDELVPITSVPLPYQIRRSNSYAIQSSLQQLGIVSDAFHIADNTLDMEQRLSQLLTQYDAIVLSGGVSKGKFDYVPATLESLGVKKLFHKVEQRPGKPFWFGHSAESSTTIFALPGNPVSTFLCLYRYVRPWIEAGLGHPVMWTTAALAEDFSFDPRLTYFLQVRLEDHGEGVQALAIPGGGSGDFANLADATGFLELPADQSLFYKGQRFPYIPFR